MDISQKEYESIADHFQQTVCLELQKIPKLEEAEFKTVFQTILNQMTGNSQISHASMKIAMDEANKQALDLINNPKSPCFYALGENVIYTFSDKLKNIPVSPRSILFHELWHVITDQYFDLKKHRLIKPFGEATAMEGSANWIKNLCEEALEKKDNSYKYSKERLYTKEEIKLGREQLIQLKTCLQNDMNSVAIKNRYLQENMEYSVGAVFFSAFTPKWQRLSKDEKIDFIIKINTTVPTIKEVLTNTGPKDYNLRAMLP